ncbi:hypothetical protein PIB30_032023 [Stylosanthes scabra]|uniref:Uncharacterized protein n=1 Tax=Stylosanthes scabra TaxID=79078 RepID=A0ABU6XAJ4_9FABA|nr:hypothetical protein [Stylosanthes scabra]
MELQNRLKISNMETQMFNLKLETAAAVTAVTARDGNGGSGGWQAVVTWKRSARVIIRQIQRHGRNKREGKRRYRIFFSLSIYSPATSGSWPRPVMPKQVLIVKLVQWEFESRIRKVANREGGETQAVAAAETRLTVADLEDRSDGPAAADLERVGPTTANMKGGGMRRECDRGRWAEAAKLRRR